MNLAQHCIGCWQFTMDSKCRLDCEIGVGRFHQNNRIQFRGQRFQAAGLHVAGREEKQMNYQKFTNLPISNIRWWQGEPSLHLNGKPDSQLQNVFETQPEQKVHLKQQLGRRSLKTKFTERCFLEWRQGQPPAGTTSYYSDFLPRVRVENLRACQIVLLLVNSFVRTVLTLILPPYFLSCCMQTFPTLLCEFYHQLSTRGKCNNFLRSTVVQTLLPLRLLSVLFQ